MDVFTVMTSPTYAKVADVYKKSVVTAATVTAYTVLARGMAWEIVPYELRAAALWAVSAVCHRLMPPPKPLGIKTIYISQYGEGRHLSDDEYNFFNDACAHLATSIDPATLRRLCLTFGDGRQVLSAVAGDTVTDVFEGVEFKWTPLSSRTAGPSGPDLLVLSFDAEQMDVALGKYVPYIVTEMEATRRHETALQIFINEHGSWEGINHQHPATFDMKDFRGA